MYQIPLVVSLALSVSGFVCSYKRRDPVTGETEHLGEIVFPLLSLYLNVMHLILYPVQRYMGAGFPSIESFYVGAIVAFIVGYCIMWHRRQPWTRWVIYFGLFALPPLILVWFGNYPWWQVLASLALGVASSLMFLVIIRYYISESLPYMMNMWPLSWLGYQDTYFCNAQQQRKFYEIRAYMFPRSGTATKTL